MSHKTAEKLSKIRGLRSHILCIPGTKRYIFIFRNVDRLQGSIRFGTSQRQIPIRYSFFRVADVLRNLFRIRSPNWIRLVREHNRKQRYPLRFRSNLRIIIYAQFGEWILHIHNSYIESHIQAVCIFRIVHGKRKKSADICDLH